MSPHRCEPTCARDAELGEPGLCESRRSRSLRGQNRRSRPIWKWASTFVADGPMTALAADVCARSPGAHQARSATALTRTPSGRFSTANSPSASSVTWTSPRAEKEPRTKCGDLFLRPYDGSAIRFALGDLAQGVCLPFGGRPHRFQRTPCLVTRRPSRQRSSVRPRSCSARQTPRIR
jgi:hypothetical protein